MTTLQENRHRKASNSIAHIVAQRDACIARLVRYEARLKLLRKQQARLERTMAAPPKPAPVLPDPAPVEAAPSPTVAMVPGIPQWDKSEPAPLTPAQIADVKQSRDELEIPSWLDRRKATEKRDAAARAEVEQQNAERKKAKAKIAAEKRAVRNEELQAKLTGELRKMPLTGRAALDKIRAG